MKHHRVKHLCISAAVALGAYVLLVLLAGWLFGIRGNVVQLVLLILAACLAWGLFESLSRPARDSNQNARAKYSRTEIVCAGVGALLTLTGLVLAAMWRLGMAA